MSPPARFLRRCALPACCLLAAATWLVAAEAPRLDPAQLSGGILTVADESEGAYLQPAPSLDGEALKLFAEGHKFFNTQWAFYWFEGGMWGRGPTSNADKFIFHRKDAKDAKKDKMPLSKGETRKSHSLTL